MTTQFDSEQKAKLTQIINEGIGVKSEVEATKRGTKRYRKKQSQKNYRSNHQCLKKRYVLHSRAVTLQKKKTRKY